MFFKKNKKNKSILGIDFRSDEVRIVELESQSKIKNAKYKYKILNFVIEKLPLGNVNEDQLDSVVIGEYLKEIVIKEKLQNKIAVTSIPSSRILEETIRIAKDASEKEIEDVIKNSSKQYVKSGIDTMAFDFYEIEKDENDDTKVNDEEKKKYEEKEIKLVMCKKELVESRFDALNLAEVTPLVIDSTNNVYLTIIPSLIKQFEFQNENNLVFNPEQTIILADVGEYTLSLYFYKNDMIWSKDFQIKRDIREENDAYLKDILDSIHKEIILENMNKKLTQAVFFMGKSECLNQLLKLEKKENIINNNTSENEIVLLEANPFFDIEYAGVHYSTIIDVAPSLVLACGLAMKEVTKYEY